MIAVLLLLLALPADVASLKDEPDLNRRSELALENADREIDAARQAVSSGDDQAEKLALEHVRESLELSVAALHEGHETPRRSKFYKKAELRLRSMVRRLQTLRDDTDVENREPVEVVLKRTHELHDELLNDIMSKRKP